MKRFLTIALVVIIAVLGFACISNAYSINIESNTKKEVAPNETFTLTIAMDEKTSLANGHINYDTKLFEFVSATQENMSAQDYTNEGYVSWMYTNTNSGIDSYTFSFKAKDVSKTSTGTFALTDAVFIAESEETYEGETLKGTSKVDVTIKVEDKAVVDDKDDKVESEDKKENTTTTTDKESGKKDNTITSDKKLPQTGKGILAYIVLALMAIAIVLKAKYKKLSKLFSALVIPVVAIMLMTTSVSALKLAETDNYQVGLFDSLIEGEKVVAINPGKAFYTSTNLSLEMLQSIFAEENLTIDKIKDSEGNVLTDTTKIATGDKVVLTDESEYTVLLYGDANGDGTICNCIDVNVIREEYVYGNKSSEIYRLAADLSPDNILNVKDVALIVKKYTNKLDGHLVTPFPDDDYELPKQKIQDEDVLKITSVDTTSNTATINIELDTTGLTANSITYEIYDAGNSLAKTHTVTDLTTVSHTFEELEPEKEYFVIVTVDCNEANYYAEQTVATKASTDEPDEPVTPPDEPIIPTDRKIEAELIISNVKAGSADMEIVLADGITLEEDDKIFFGHSAGSHGGQTQHDELSYQKTNLDANKEQTFWATIYDKDNNTLWFSEYQSAKTPAIEFDLVVNKDAEDPKTKIAATLSNINSDKFDFDKIQCKVEKITFDDEGEPSAWTVVLNEEIKSLDKNIIFTQLTPGESYNVEVRIYDTSGNYTKKTVENIKMDSDTTTEPVQPDEPTEPDEPRELTAELEVIDLGEDSITVKINLSDELLDGETIKYALTPGPNGGETSGFITDTEYTFSGLGKNIPYSIIAAVYNEDGTEICKTETIIANIVEDNIEIAKMETTANSIKVRLSGAPNRVITENDKIIFKVTDTSNNVKATSLEYSIGEANGSGHTFTGLNPNTEYYVYAILQNENGITATSNILDITTNEEEPVTPDEPAKDYSATLRVDEPTVTTSSLLVQLTITPQLENYTVKYYANGTTSYESTTNTHTFENLNAGETYAFWAEVYNEDGEKVATTDMVTQLIPSPDINIFVESNSENPESSILVSAIPYYNTTDTFTIEKYDMWISKVNTEDSTYTDVKLISDVECTDGAFENYEIKGLEANTTYIITVKGTDNGGNEVTKTATITTAEAPRELEGYLEVTNNFEGTVSLKINITNGDANLETDKIYFRNTTMAPTETNESTKLSYTYSSLPINDTEITFYAKVIDTVTGITYSMDSVAVRTMKVEPVTIEATTANTVTVSGTLPNNLINEKIVYKISDNNGYENEYETTLAELNTLNFEYKFTGLEENTNYNVWFEIYDENGKLLTNSDKVQAKTSRELEINLELVSTDDSSAKTTLTATKGEFLQGDYMKLSRGVQEIPGQIPLNVFGATKIDDLIFGNITANETVKLSVIVYDANDTKLAEDSIDVLIRDVEITQFEISNLEARNVIEARAISQATGVMETDNVVYEIRRKGETSSIANEGKIGTYTYKDLIPGETYYFTLKVYDDDWNLLAESAEKEYTVPTPKIDLTLFNVENNPSTKVNARVAVANPEETVGFTPNEYDYYVYKVNNDGSTTEVKRNLNATTSEWTITDLLPSTEYKVVVTATDKENNTSATAEKTITTANAVDTIIVRPKDGAVIDNYDPTPGSGNQDKNGGFSSIDIITCDDENLLNLPVSGTIEIEVKNAKILSSIYSESLKYIEGASYTAENGKVIITLEEVTLSQLKNQPIVLSIADNLTEEDKVEITTTTDLKLNNRDDITFEGQTIELPIEYRVDETPEIELNVTNEAESDKATATIDVTNLAKVDKYYYKLYIYGYNNSLYPVEGSNGSWVESDSNEYVFDNLAENTTYLVVVKAESTQGNYSEEKKYEFTTTAFKPVIELTANPTEEQPATQITVESAVTNSIAIKNYQFALIDNEHKTEDGKAIYIEMPVEANSTNSYNFIGLYPNTQYTAFGQAESEKGVMSNYNNKSVSTKVIRDTLTVADQTTTDSITVTADDTNLRRALQDIYDARIYDIDMSTCRISYFYKAQDGEQTLGGQSKTTGIDLNKELQHTFNNLKSGLEYELWAEITDSDGKLIWTTKQLVKDPITGEETEEESGEIVELEALQIASIEANRRQEYSLDVRVKLDEESLKRLANNANYTYNVEVYTVASIENSTNSQGPSPVIAKTQFTKGGEYQDIIGEDSINFTENKYYSDEDEEGNYLGDILQIKGLDPETNYRVVVTVSDENGGTAKIEDINRKDIKTRAAVPEIHVDYNYEQVAYENDAMDAEQLNRVATATVSVTNDAVIDYEYLNTSGFNFKLYKGETVNSEELVNPTQQTIRYYYNEYVGYDEMTKLEKDLAREKTADSDEHLQKWEYTRSDLTADQSYLWNVKAISRVGKESEVSSHTFTAVWNTVELEINVYQDTANSPTLYIFNKVNGNIPNVKEYTINIVNLNDADGVVYDSNGEITALNWGTGEAVYTNTFTAENFTSNISQAIKVDDIENLDLNNQYVIIIEAEAENGTTRTYYELIDTTAIARVSYMGNSSYYTTLQSAVDNAPSNSNVYLMKNTRESVKFEKNGREGVILTSENNAKMIRTGDSPDDESRIYVDGETGIILENFEISGRVFIYEDSLLNIRDNVKITANNYRGLYIREGGTADIQGKNIDITGYEAGIYNDGGDISITTLATTSDDEAIKITSTAENGATIQSAIYNSGTLKVTSKNTTDNTNKELILKGCKGINNEGTLVIQDGKNIDILGTEYGIYNNEDGTLTISEGKNILVEGGIDAIVNQDNGIINIENVEGFSVIAKGVEGTGIYNNSKTGTVNVENTTSGSINIDECIYGIQNFGCANITGKNITISADRAGIYNQGECYITSGATDNLTEAINIDGVINAITNSSGKLLITTSEDGTNQEINITSTIGAAIYNDEESNFDISSNNLTDVAENSRKVNITSEENSALYNTGNAKIIGNSIQLLSQSQQNSTVYNSETALLNITTLATNHDNQAIYIKSMKYTTLNNFGKVKIDISPNGENKELHMKSDNRNGISNHQDAVLIINSQNNTIKLGQSKKICIEALYSGISNSGETEITGNSIEITDFGGSQSAIVNEAVLTITTTATKVDDQCISVIAELNQGVLNYGEMSISTSTDGENKELEIISNDYHAISSYGSNNVLKINSQNNTTKSGKSKKIHIEGKGAALYTYSGTTEIIGNSINILGKEKEATEICSGFNCVAESAIIKTVTPNINGQGILIEGPDYGINNGSKNLSVTIQGTNSNIPELVVRGGTKAVYSGVGAIISPDELLNDTITISLP